MPSLRKRVAGFIRQLSVSPNQSDNTVIHGNSAAGSSGCFIHRYLNGDEMTGEEPMIVHGRVPQELPRKSLGMFDVGSDSVVATVTGPDDGLTTVNKKQRHLSISDPDVDYIDILDTQHAESDRVAADNSNRVEEIAGVCDWKRPHVNAYGAAMTLYEKNPLTGENAGNPIADCFALVARKDSAVLALADGVNWGEKASVAARSAIHGCVQHLDQALYNPAVPRVANTTEVFVALLRSFHAAHSMILQEDGMLTTLTAAVVLPMAAAAADKYVVCVCNVGDSLAYVYSTRHGVREITKGSHDIHCMRDMRDALGALGPVDGQNPELNNLTCSMTEIDAGDIVFLTSDGVSDNFDPVVGKFAVLPANGSPTSLRPSQKTNPGTIEIHVRGSSNVYGSANSGRNQQGSGFADVASFAGNQTKLAAGPSSGNRSRRNQWTKPMSNFNKAKMNVSDFSFTSTLPTVQAFQRHELSLLRMDDLLRHGVSGNGPPCDNAQSLCEMLLDFATRLTAAKRHILEDADLYLEPDETAENGVKELSKAEQRSRRKKVLDKLQMVPGKLDHASVVAYKAGFGGTDEAPIRETKI